jgi:hypothetical protein
MKGNIMATETTPNATPDDATNTNATSTAAPVDTSPAEAVRSAYAPAPANKRKGLILAGVIGGSVLAAGLLLGGGVAIGSTLHGGPGGPGDDRLSSDHMQGGAGAGGQDGGEDGDRKGDDRSGTGDNDGRRGPGHPPVGEMTPGQPPVDGVAPPAPGTPLPDAPADTTTTN